MTFDESRNITCLKLDKNEKGTKGALFFIALVFVQKFLRMFSLQIAVRREGLETNKVWLENDCKE